ncbi:hypothetical protein GCM10010295_23820 [Streptomyces intermedius]
MVEGGQGEGFFAAACFGYDLDAGGAGEEGAQAGADHGVVVAEEEAYGGRGGRLVGGGHCLSLGLA